MSKPLDYDSLLVRSLCEALRARYRRARVRAVRMDVRNRTVRVAFGRTALVWNLEPAGGGLYEERVRGPLTGTVLPRGMKVADVRVAPDDRLIEWRFEEPESGRQSELWIELLPNRRNAVLMAGGRVIAALDQPRTAAADPGGANWQPPEPRPRAGAVEPLTEDGFVALLHEVNPAQRRRALLAGVAYTSPLNAGPILGDAVALDTPAALENAWVRYRRLVAGQDLRPGIVEPGRLDQPYPVPLPGLAFEAATDLLAAFAVASATRSQVVPTGDRDVLDELARRRRSLETKIERLRAELAGAGADAERWRHDADLLLGNLHVVRRGMSEVVLDDWSGGQSRIELDPALDPAANARRLYEQAKKKDRAVRRLPQIIDTGVARLARLQQLEERHTAGEASAEDLAAELPAMRAAGGRERTQRALPYRIYRTTGGLEVRVGRSSRANDELTLHHSVPDDIWLHARDAGGAHVVLRWGSRDTNPPAADLAEAGVLAALHSRARTSGTVPVDYTRRKYVRKPRKAPPGRVVMERARTLFVRPDPGLEERLRQE